MDSRNILELTPAPADFRLPYGAAPRQFGDLRVPKTGDKHPVVIVLHGGFWRNSFNLAYMGHVCESLRSEGIATWNLEYRSIGDPGGGWPGTCQDVASGASYLRVIAGAHHLDLSRLTALGHSAGGHLALWLAAKRNPGLVGIFGLGAVADLQRALSLKLSNTVVEQFLNGSDLKLADPMHLLPLRAKLRLFHGVSDNIVPIGIAEGFAKAAQAAGDDARLIRLDGGHFEPVDPGTPQWNLVKEEIGHMVR